MVRLEAFGAVLCRCHVGKLRVDYEATPIIAFDNDIRSHLGPQSNGLCGRITDRPRPRSLSPNASWQVKLKYLRDRLLIDRPEDEIVAEVCNGSRTRAIPGQGRFNQEP